MNQKLLYVLFGVSLGLNISLGGAMAYWLTRPEKVPGVGAWERPFAKLPPALRAKLREARREDMPQFRRIGRDLADTHARLYEELRKEAPEEARIEEEMKRITELHSALQSLVVKRILKDSKSLTPEERELYFEAIKDRLLRMGGPGGFGPGRCPPPWAGPGPGGHKGPPEPMP